MVYIAYSDPNPKPILQYDFKNTINYSRFKSYQKPC